MSYSITYTKQFTKGNLKGISMEETMTFVDKNHADKWLYAKPSKVNYKILSVSHPECIKKSEGHLNFVGDFEYFVFQGAIYKASTKNVIGVNGIRDGRWECSLSHAKLYPDVYGYILN